MKRIWLQIEVKEIGNGLVLDMYHSEQNQYEGPRPAGTFVTDTKDGVALTKIIQQVARRIEEDFGEGT